jgi:O-methyltransferase involved in polyketide biosynthesis
MTEREASGTAVGVAILRAAYMPIDGEPKILDDPVSPRLFDAPVLEGIRADPGRLRTPGALALRSHVLVRSAAMPRTGCAGAYQRGVRQCVMLGAGLDTFAYRQPDIPPNVRSFRATWRPSGWRSSSRASTTRAAPTAWSRRAA